jgi:hypothetical protein
MIEMMDDIQNPNSYINVPSSQTNTSFSQA